MRRLQNISPNRYFCFPVHKNDKKDFSQRLLKKQAKKLKKANPKALNLFLVTSYSGKSPSKGLTPTTAEVNGKLLLFQWVKVKALSQQSFTGTRTSRFGPKFTSVVKTCVLVFNLKFISMIMSRDLTKSRRQMADFSGRSQPVTIFVGLLQRSQPIPLIGQAAPVAPPMALPIWDWLKAVHHAA